MQSPSRNVVMPTLLGALVFVLGMQATRYLFASVTWYLRDTVGVATLDLIPIAVAPFLAAAVFPMAARFAGVRRSLWLGLIVLVGGRLVNQVTDDPGVGLWAAAIATAAFVGLLPLLLSLGRPVLVGGLLLGLTLDTSIKGLGLSLDPAYQPGLRAVAVTVLVAAGAVFALWQTDLGYAVGVAWGSGALLLGLGPYLFAQQTVLQSQGWTAAAGSVSAGHALVRIAFLNVVAVYLAFRLERPRPVLLASALVMSGALIGAEASAPVFNLLAALGVVAAGPVWAAMVPDTDRRRITASAVYLIGGALIYLVVGLAYYLPMDLDLGFTQAQARIVAAVLLGVFGVAGALARPRVETGVARVVPALAGLTVVLPIVTAGAVLVSDPVPPDDSDGTVRVMSYNLHSAFDTSGRMDVEAIARVIEDSQATVVGLQEVSRGRLINAGTDLVALLQHRLGFEHVAFFGTTDPAWGNAILSRHPLGPVETVHLPTAGTPLRRGFLAAPVEVGDTEFLFISTHLQHINDPDVHDDDPEADLLPVHRAQIGAILEEWDGRTPAVLVGDFNARPGWAQMEELLAAGWVDSWEEAGEGPGYTARSDDPRYRIDWILHTPDLEAVDAGVFQSQASDHFAVITDVSLAG